MIDPDSQRATLWVRGTRPEVMAGKVFLWEESLGDEPLFDYHSIPDLVDANAERLRAEYQNWLHELSQIDTKGSTVTDFLAIRKELSFWWMTIPSLQSLDVNSPVFTSIRLLVLDELVTNFSICIINVVGADASLLHILRPWASTRGIDLEYGGEISPEKITKKILRALPAFGALWVAFKVIPRLKIRFGLNKSLNASADVAFIDYFIASDEEEISSGDFLRRYWGPLVNKFHNTLKESVWMHIPITGVNNEDSKKVRALEDFSLSRRRETHLLLSSRISATVFFKSVWTYLILARRLVAVNEMLSNHNQTQRERALWRSVDDQKRNFFWGAESMLNCIWINVFEEALKRRSPIPCGFYLFENQPWEFALVTAWRNAGHGELFGVSHTTMLPWDLRYFKGEKTMNALLKSNQMPFPTKILVNGSLMLEAALKGHYPAERLLQVESLRYESFRHEKSSLNDFSEFKILLLGDYSPQSTAHMVKTLAQSVIGISERCEIIFRSHPGNLKPDIKLEPDITESVFPNIQHAINWADVVICGSSSSSAIDVVLGGKRPIVINFGQGFNCNPFSSTSYADFVSTPSELRLQILNADLAERTVPSSDESFVDTNPKLLKWSGLIESLDQR